MTFIIGKNSLKEMSNVHSDLRKVIEEAIKSYNFSVICGFRGEQAQNEAFARGKSKVKWPNSRHNKTPAEAVDLCPYPVDWNNLKAFREMAEHVKEAAEKVGVEIEWGGECFGTFVDMPHFQLKKK